MVFKKKAGGGTTFFQRQSTKKDDSSNKKGGSDGNGKNKGSTGSKFKVDVAAAEAAEERVCVDTRAERWGRLIIKPRSILGGAKDVPAATAAGAAVGSDDNGRDDDHTCWVLPKDSFEVISGRFSHVKSSPRLASNTVRRSRPKNATSNDANKNTETSSFANTSFASWFSNDSNNAHTTNDNTTKDDTSTKKDFGRTRTATPFCVSKYQPQDKDDSNDEDEQLDGTVNISHHGTFLEAIEENESNDSTSDTSSCMNTNNDSNGSAANNSTSSVSQMMRTPYQQNHTNQQHQHQSRQSHQQQQRQQQRKQPLSPKHNHCEQAKGGPNKYNDFSFIPCDSCTIM
jgi:hypothetical protein